MPTIQKHIDGSQSNRHVRIPFFVFERCGDDLLVYCHLRKCADAKTGQARPGIRYLATQTGLSHDTVQRKLAHLEAAKAITITKRKGAANQYGFPSDPAGATTRIAACTTTRMDACADHAPVRVGVHATSPENDPRLLIGDLKNINPKQSTSNPESKPVRLEPSKVDLPEWLPRDAWGELVEHRRSLKKPVTALGAKKLIATLAKFRAAGSDPQAVIDQSIANGWLGLFDVKPSANPKKRPKPHYLEDDLPPGKIQ